MRGHFACQATTSPALSHCARLADADRLRPLLRPGVRIAIIGAGYIGLEVAASARALGADVVVIEREARVLARVASDPAVGLLPAPSRGRRCAHHAERRGGGVRRRRRPRSLRCACRMAAPIPCDAVLIGIGAAPNDALARAAGLACDNGIVVDLAARTVGSPPSTRSATARIGRCRCITGPAAWRACRTRWNRRSRPPPICAADRLPRSGGAVVLVRSVRGSAADRRACRST